MRDVESNYPRERRTAKPSVIFGLLVGALLSLIFLASVMPIGTFRNATDARRAGSISNLKQIALGHEMYLQDSDGYGPPPATWADLLAPYTSPRIIDYKKDYSLLFKSPHNRQTDGDDQGYGYAYFRPLGGVQLSSISNPAGVPFAFDSSDMRWNANGDLSLLPDPPRWKGTNLIAFLDTHVARVEGTPKVEIKMAEEPE